MAKRKKTGGRQKGTPNKATEQARAAAVALVEDVLYRRNLKARLRTGKVHPLVENMLWHYAYGKPPDRVELSGPDGEAIPVQQIPDEQLQARLAELEKIRRRLLKS